MSFGNPAFAIPQQNILPFCLPAFCLAGRGEKKRGPYEYVGCDLWDNPDGGEIQAPGFCIALNHAAPL